MGQIGKNPVITASCSILPVILKCCCKKKVPLRFRQLRESPWKTR